ncbi:MAG: DUF4126 family protein [Verrucomicrobia bacterium]|nr:DUF4126 family protein [Verrucomicrobiota bacterium]
MMRYGNNLPYLGDISFLQTAVDAAPTWFTSNWTIAALGLLALGEVLATKSAEVQELMDGVHKHAKAGMGALTVLGVMGASDVEFIERTITTAHASLLDSIIAGMTAAAIYAVNFLRTLALSILWEADPDGDLGIRGLMSWFEDIWAAAGIFFLFVYPVFMLLLVAVVFGLLALARRYHRYREEKNKVSCPECGGRIYASALICQHCSAEIKQPKTIGFFGQAKEKPIQDRLSAGIDLASKKRCPHCATHLPKRDPAQICPGCGRQPFADSALLTSYIGVVTQRLPKVLAITFGLSLIPVIGLIPGIIYYRISLVAPFRGYIPAGQSFLLKWLLRLFLLVLITLQIVPGLGGFSVPIMALLSYLVYRGAFSAKIQPQGVTAV